MKIRFNDQGQKSKYIVWNQYESQIIGDATLDDSTEPVVLENINIKRNRRNKGIGSKLLKQIISDYENTEIIADTFTGRVDWYKRHGFEKEEKNGKIVKVRKD